MADFNKAADLTLKLEAGYQNLKGDTGNYNSLKQNVGTNYGISAKIYEKWIKRPPTVADIKAINKAKALEIYKAWYWKPLSADQFKDQQIANFLFDYAINGGTGDAVLGLIRAWNVLFTPPFKLTKVMGNKLQAAINSLTPERSKMLFDALKNERIHDIRTQGSTQYDDSLVNRVTKFTYKIVEQVADKVKNDPSKTLIWAGLAFFFYKMFISSKY